MPRILLVNPPLTDPSGPYPSICYLAGYLETLGIHADLADASLLLLLRILSRSGVEAVTEGIRARLAVGSYKADPRVQAFLERSEWYARTVDTAVACLQGTDRAAIARADRDRYFPPPLDERADWAKHTFLSAQAYEAALGELTPAQRSRLATSPTPLRFAFGSRGETDRAIYRASLMVHELGEVVRAALDPAFELDAYAPKLSEGAGTFEPLATRLSCAPTVIDDLVDALTDELARHHRPDVVGLTAPFPGSAYGALRMAARFKAINPEIRTILGGGWVNTELRELSDPAIFDLVDFITLDDGELPLRCLLEHLAGARSADALSRTLVRRGGAVVRIDGAQERDVPASQIGTPTYRDLPLHRYLCYRPSLQIMPRVVGVRWNKLTLAHGCYWKKCAFCDTALDYIGRYEPASVDALVARIRRLTSETGETGFHFVDEAMPPALLGRISRRIIDDHLDISWWGNVRFDSALIPLAPALAESGCVAITGGLEVASDRVLALMEKGISIAQAAQVMRALAKAGIVVHAYLIYGFPTETEQETIDALEFVRQLFAEGFLHSAYWHRFTLTKFSPVARDPNRFGIAIKHAQPRPFANYVLDYEEPGGISHDRFTTGLRHATDLYMAGVGLGRPVQSWFPEGTCAPTLAPDFVRRFAENASAPAAAAKRRRLNVQG